jgi:tetratricopeptide (TPR) repeat protein
MILAPAVALLLAAAPISQPELTALGNRIAADYAAGRDGLTQLLDVDGLLDRTLAGVPAPEDFLRGFRNGAKKTTIPMGANLLKEAKAGGTIAFRSLGRNGGEDVIRLRLLSSGGAFNYFELFTARGGGGALRVVDVYDLADGGTLSATIRRLALLALAEAKQGLLDRLGGKEQVFLKSAATIKKMSRARVEGRHAEVLSIYETLPREIQEEPVFMRQVVYASMELDQDKYRRAMERYIRRHPDDPAANVMAIDACFLRKDWAGANKAIDGVERHVGTDDGWLALLRGSVAKTAGDLAGARRHFEEATRREPALTQAHANLLDLALKAGDWAAAARALSGLEQAGQPIADLRKVEGFEGFVASKEGKAFLKRKKTR